MKSRNRLLVDSSADRRAIMAYDELLASSGSVIGKAREALVSSLSGRISEAFRGISGDREALSVSYRPRVEPTVAAIRQALERSLEKDLARGFTAEGPHGDELLLKVGSSRARHYASQGQHRSIALALKIAELRELERRTARTPLVLLDDVSNELDASSNRRLFALLTELGSQVFLTTTRASEIGINVDRTDFWVKEGVISERL